MNIKLQKRILSVVLCALLAGAGICGCSGGNTESAGNEIEQQNSAAENNKNTENDTVEEADNENNEIVFSAPYEIVECLGGYFIATSNDGKLYGVLDSKGETVVDFKYDELSFDNQKKPEFLYATLEGKYGTLDLSGNEIIPITYTSLDKFAGSDYYDYSYTVARIGDITYILSKSGEVIKNITSYTGVIQSTRIRVYLDSLIAVYCGGTKEIILDLDGKVLIDENILIAGYCCNPSQVFAYIYDGTQQGYIIDKSGNIVLKQSSEYLVDNYLKPEFFSDKYCIVGNSNDRYVKNISTDEKGSISYSEIERTYNGKAFACTHKNISTEDKKLNILDESGNVINTVCEDVKNVALSPGVAIVSLDGETYRAYDLDGNDVFDDRFYDVSEHDGYFLLKNVNDQYALLSPYGKLLADFGNITENTYMGQTIQNQVSSDDMYCICVSNNGSNEVHAFYAK